MIIGDCLEVMKTFPDNHFTSVVTDPPYGLHFMGKDWDKYAKGTCKIGRKIPGALSNSEAHDAGRYDDRKNDEFQSFMTEMATEALRITKPGGHMVMFGAPRRYHRQACAIEDAGWEIRDSLMWLFGSGFPKSHNFGRKLGDDWEGYGTALKPAYEPILLAMKPLEGTFLQNAEKWGVAGLNIDESRIAGKWERSTLSGNDIRGGSFGANAKKRLECDPQQSNPLGRWPANLLFDEEAASQLGSPSRFFYCAKTSSKERNEGLDRMPLKECHRYGAGIGEGHDPKSPAFDKNNHPTVKPLALMRYLLTLIAPPNDALILDPFAGSGTTLLAAKQLGISAIGIEKSPEYAQIATARLESTLNAEVS